MVVGQMSKQCETHQIARCGFASGIAESLRVSTGDGRFVKVRIDEQTYLWTALKADIVAQGLAMAILRTDLPKPHMPWDGGEILRVSPIEPEPRRMGTATRYRFEDVTWYGEDPTYRFFGDAFLYHGAGADPDYPANVFVVKTRHEGDIVLTAGTTEHFLSPTQAVELCFALSNACYSLTHRSWNILNKRIEWSCEPQTTQSVRVNAKLIKDLRAFKFVKQSYQLPCDLEYVCF